MKLAVDVRCLQDKYWTGVSNYTWNNVLQLANHNDVSQIFYSNSVKNNQLPGNLDKLGTTVNRHFPNKLQNMAWQLNIWPPIDKLLGESNRPDWLWIPNPIFFRASHNVKTALTIHDLSFVHFPQFFSLKKRIWYLNYVKNILKRQLDSLDLIIAVSENTCRDIMEVQPGIGGKIKVVYPGVEDNFFRRVTTEEISAVIAAHNLPKKYLLSVGTLEPRKNHLLLLKMYDELLSRYPNFSADLVLAGPTGQKVGGLLKYWKSLKSRSRIHFTPFIPRRQLPAIYQGATIFLFPSFYEGFGFPVLEAMASRTPCIVSNTSSLPELAGDTALLLNPWNYSEWVDAVYHMYENLSSVQEKVDRAFERSQLFSWRVSADKLYDLFKQP